MLWVGADGVVNLHLRFLSCIDSLRFSLSRMFCMFAVFVVVLASGKQ